jgi:hypothetical protein
MKRQAALAMTLVARWRELSVSPWWWSSSRPVPLNVARPAGAFFESAPHASPRGSLDFVSKDVVADANVVASPGNDARPSQPAEETPTRPSPSRARHQASDDPYK